MSEKNSLFGESVVSSNEDIDKDYDIDANGIDIDPNDETLKTQTEEPFDETSEESALTTPINPDTIFKEEPLENADIIYTKDKDSKKPKKKKSHKGLFIVSIIILAILAAFGGFALAHYLTISKTQQTQTQQPVPQTNTTEEETTNNNITIETPSNGNSQPSNETDTTDSTDSNTESTDTTDSTEKQPVYDDSNADQEPMDYDLEIPDDPNIKDYQQPDYQNKQPIN